MDITSLDIRSLVTVISFVTFIGIVVWVLNPRRKSSFKEAANLPFADEPDQPGTADTKNHAEEKRHG